MKKILGYSIFVLLWLVVFVIIALSEGLVYTIIFWGGMSLFVGLVFLGIYLITEPKK